jgi:hypothetical protein
MKYIGIKVPEAFLYLVFGLRRKVEKEIKKKMDTDEDKDDKKEE